jgi:KDO2-lipid IV(A) lauroyltransferase
MQWKITRSSHLSERFNRWAVARGFPTLAWLAPRAPRWFLHGGARVVIAVVMFLHSRPRRAIARNLARVLGAPEGSRRVRRAVSQMLFHFAVYWVDLFRFAQLPPERLREQVEGGTLATLEPLRQAIAAGRRTILITAHLGNWELGAVMAGQAHLPVSVVYVPDEFGEAEYFRSLLRTLGRVEEIPIRPGDQFASLPVLRAFAQGRIVALQGDRDFRENGAPLPFFGAPVTFPVGPFLLARMTGATLLPCFIVYTERRRFKVELGETIEVARSDDRERDVHQALERWVAVLEAAVRRWPTQWYTFYDFWPEPDGVPAAAAPAPETAPPPARGTA